LTVLFVFSLFSAQLLRLQALDASPVASAALKSRLYVSAVPAMRGDITDANGVVLATSIDRRNVTADQTAVPEYKKKINGVRQTVGVLGAAADLAPILGMSEVELTTTLTGARRFVYVAKGHHPAELAQDRGTGDSWHLQRADLDPFLPERLGGGLARGLDGRRWIRWWRARAVVELHVERPAGQVDLRAVPGRPHHPHR